MREASWKDCLEKNSAVKTSPNKQRANSLTETSRERIELIKEVNEKNCNFVFEDYYTSLLELLQALIIKDGYKILNHICIAYYIKEILKREDLFMTFDDLRYKRNSLIYYGSRMDVVTCKEAIKKCKYLIKEIKNVL